MSGRFLFVPALMVCLLGAASAQAYNGCGGYGFGLGYMYGSLDYRVPYFAAHPPVYYSYPVPRTYGYSPFAYGPNVMTPEIVSQVEPLEIVNPYVPSSTKQETKPSADQAVDARVIEPLVIENPFVTSPRVMQASF
ncbi:MAG: hypothetical protein KDA37_00755 [Planctomycetales bacterium]|nr:hypothetical protein [Planctomycetales bacterium]